MNGVIFDFNGTMFDDSAKHEEAWRAVALEAFNRNILNEEFEKYIHGRNSEFIVEYISDFTLKDPEKIEYYVDFKEQYYLELCENDHENTRFDTDLIDLLNDLKVRQIPMTIATGSRKPNVDYYWRAFNLGKWFNKQDLTYNDGTSRGKPHPDFYLKAAAKIGVAPTNCLVFEDAISGVESAYKAGIGKIIVIDRHKTFVNSDKIFSTISSFSEFDKNLLT